MRRIVLLTILSVSALSVFAYNEEVAAISYNPSRLGVYENLMVVKKATFTGPINVEAAMMNIQPAQGQKITLRDDSPQHRCVGGAGGCAQANLNQITTITANSNQETVEMQGMMQGFNNGNPYLEEEYTVDKEPQPAANQGTIITLNGGNLNSTGHSYIGKITGDGVKQLDINIDTYRSNNGNFFEGVGSGETIQLGSMKVPSPGNNCALTTVTLESKFLADGSSPVVLGAQCKSSL